MTNSQFARVLTVVVQTGLEPVDTLRYHNEVEALAKPAICAVEQHYV